MCQFGTDHAFHQARFHIGMSRVIPEFGLFARVGVQVVKLAASHVLQDRQVESRVADRVDVGRNADFVHVLLVTVLDEGFGTRLTVEEIASLHAPGAFDLCPFEDLRSNVVGLSDPICPGRRLTGRIGPEERHSLGLPVLLCPS